MDINTTGPWNCPVCNRRLDCQEVEPYTANENRKFKHWLYCHHCHTQITMHTHEYAYYFRYHDKETQRPQVEKPREPTVSSSTTPQSAVL